MTSYTTTETNSFTMTHARYIASKVATDLKRFQRFYSSPSDDWIDRYEGELAGLLKHDLVDNVVYGFQRNSLWTPASVRYRAIPGGSLLGGRRPRQDQAGYRRRGRTLHVLPELLHDMVEPLASGARQH